SELVTTPPKWRKVAEVPATGIAGCFECLEVLARVNAQQVLFGCQWRATDADTGAQSRDVHQRLETSLAVWRFRMTRSRGRLHPSSHRHHECMHASAMPQATFVVKKASFPMHASPYASIVVTAAARQYLLRQGTGIVQM